MTTIPAHLSYVIKSLSNIVLLYNLAAKRRVEPMTKEERKEIQDELIASASELGLGIALKDPPIVSHIAENPEYLDRFGRNWMCEDYCPYKHQCLQFRPGEPAPLIQVSGRIFGTR